VLALEEQIKDENVSFVSSASETSFFVKFKDLRPNGYLQKFPGRENYVFQHLASHFLPIFIGGRCPITTVSVGSETRVYPEAIKDIVYRRLPDIEIPTKEYGLLKLTLMECDKVASSDLNGSHFIHLIAHDRTVHSQSIDGKLGLKYFGTNGDRVFHGILVGEYLDTNVNQQRTAFTFEDSIIDKIINDICDPHIRNFLAQPLEKLKVEQGRIIELITSTYPSIAFGTADELQQKIPAGEMSNDAIYGHLSREKYRRDERQATKIRGVLSRLKGSTGDADTLTSAIKDATAALEEAEQKSLAEYVVRRKVVLDFIELLLEKVRDVSSDSAYQREDILHSFICPLRINNISNGQTGRQVQAAASHDLWIIDERLTFAEYFSSDVEFSALAETYNSEDRADILVFDHVHGLRQTNGHSRVLLVEFKRPGREAYADNENPIEQVNRYIRRLQTNQLKDVRGRPLNIDQQTIFHAFVIADIVGKIDDWTYNWDRTADGRGRMNSSKHGYVGTIEVMGWDALIADAKARNKSFFDRIGISGKSFFSLD